LADPVCRKYVAECSVWSVVKVPVNGKFSAGELTRRDPQLFATSEIVGGAEAHLHIAPLKLLGEVLYRWMV
jgi:hypothetical protein